MIRAAKSETNSFTALWNEAGVPMIRIILCDDGVIFLERMRGDIRTVLRQLDINAVIEIFSEAETIPQKAMQDLNCSNLFGQYKKAPM